MYILVDNKQQVKPYRDECWSILYKAQKKLRQNEDITMDVNLVGSGSKKIVTKNGDDGTFDLDFNLILHRIPRKYKRDLLLLKRTIRQEIDSVVNSYNYSHGKDSTSVITYVKHDKQGKPVFHFDVGLIYADKATGNYERLVYEDSSKTILTWNEVFSSKKLNRRAKKIRQQGKFNEVKQRYVELKNQALSRQENTASYSLYAQAVNDVWQTII